MASPGGAGLDAINTRAAAMSMAVFVTQTVWPSRALCKGLRTNWALEGRRLPTLQTDVSHSGGLASWSENLTASKAKDGAGGWKAAPLQRASNAIR